MALRLSREAASIELPQRGEEVVTLPSVARVLAAAGPLAPDAEEEAPQEPDPETGDDDAADDLGAADEDDFYADAFEDA